MAGEATLSEGQLNGHNENEPGRSAPLPHTSKQKSGIKVLIVGAGFGGLCAAIECHRQGHDVEILESFRELKVLGDIISFGSNAGRIFRRWFIPETDGERISDRLDPLSIKLQNYGFNIHKWTGELVMNQRTPPPDPEAPVFNGHRGEFHSVLLYYAKDDLGIPIRLGYRIEKYFEDTAEAGVVLESGEKISADVVVGADGVRSKARELVLGYEDKPKFSGYAVFRAWFTNDEMMKDPETRRFCENGDTFNGWIGPDVHFLFSTIKNGSDCCWVLTHVDEADSEESWSFPGKLGDVYKVFEGWDPLCKRIVSKTPENKLVDWNTQGATQAMEDGVTIAICLREAGKQYISAGVKAYQDIRYDRVKAVQKTGETTRVMWHKADWDKVKEDPKSIGMPREDWILGHDAEKHAEAVVANVVRKFM
ncbi:hypothetical protein LTR37_002795 [Vermiconidia calcicola]|uniref:Uncharacterized protein n=1 Tax=Vermiconidia calcicola TaxID=1690605 RepID=A0ACC3NS87_9PEZI|nr:hypothetical protein LTR37_002795 [Vermiconidia calcicola]